MPHAPTPRWRRIAAVFLISPLLMASDCGDEGPSEPVITGTIMGHVLIDGQPASGVTVSLDGSRTFRVDADGRYSFDEVEEGVHVVEIFGVPADATFPTTAKTATVSSQGQNVVVDFNGSFVRGAIAGNVTVDDRGLAGITVRLTGGPEERSATTDENGDYMIRDVRFGEYTVEPEDLNTAGECDPSSAMVTVAQVGTTFVNFLCRITATAGISISDADAEDGAVAGGTTIEVPVVGMKDGASAEVGTARIVTGAAGGYFLDKVAGHFFADFPGFIILDFGELPELFRLYTVFSVALALADKISSTCLLDITGEDADGSAIETLTLNAFRAVALLQLAQAMRQIRMQMRATDPGACDGGFWAISGGAFPPPE